MDDLDKDLDRRYREMRKRCGLEEEYSEEYEEDEETTEEGIYMGDLNVNDPKPEMVGRGIGFERIRRITGYLVGDVRRWNNGKKAELRDRKFHG